MFLALQELDAQALQVLIIRSLHHQAALRLRLKPTPTRADRVVACQNWAPSTARFDEPGKPRPKINDGASMCVFPKGDTVPALSLTMARDFSPFVISDNEITRFCESLDIRNITLHPGKLTAETSPGECSWYEGDFAGAKLSQFGFGLSIGLVWDDAACDGDNNEHFKTDGVNLRKWGSGSGGAARRCHDTFVQHILEPCKSNPSAVREQADQMTGEWKDDKAWHDDDGYYNTLGGRHWQDCMCFTLYAVPDLQSAPETDV